MRAVDDEDTPQFEAFRDCLSAAIVSRITKPSSKPKRRPKKTKSTAKTEPQHEPPDENAVSAEDMVDFTSYLASETFECFPDPLKTLTHASFSADAALQTLLTLPLTGSDAADLLPALSPSVADSLVAYNIINPTQQGAHEFLAPVLSEYVAAQTAPPPPPRSTRDQADGCELCGRDWIGLTYHHLIPRMVHEKVVKRGWHREEELNNVAWLCRLCHSFVHRFAGHEELARYYYTTALLLEQDEVVKFAQYASRVRWKGM
ncbi:hypothetical protein Cob_v005401 [Colletotrichum orbiculare MAFF 240422]|uniref:YisB protein n=1 Tax=Colletotrichum orbiculare (strain 104-T / ATCC 96160 / CBS 514.97 / LARS 414 / MAFF 240422) TaxID=1213857 RepID=A0A484FUX6_COLOR|nr:hypothetical protein Cob_v005401 [Colletotrichum orbiculare MAFF 240422]